MTAVLLPDFLTHYYEAADGPFRNLSDLPAEQAEALLDRIRQAGRGFAARRRGDYLAIRHALEEEIRHKFILKGGAPDRARPHYMILGADPWLLAWYPNGRELRIPLAAFDPLSVSFTYGDSFPALRVQDGKPYRGQVYRLDELPGLVAQYGLPQVWNPRGEAGPERYIEAQIWCDDPLEPYLPAQAG